MRTRILVSYALVVVFSLFLAGVVALLLLINYQQQIAITRTRDLATALISDLTDATGDSSGELPADLFRRLRREAVAMGGRFLIVNADGLVLQDTADAGKMVGQRLQITRQKARLALNAQKAADIQAYNPIRYRAPDGKVYYLTPIPLQRLVARAAGQAPRLFLVVATPADLNRQAWRDLVIRLGGASLLALLLSLVVGFILSRSITRPLRTLTVATQQVARGHYDQSVPVEGHDELAALARGFNTMAQEVQRARQTERELLANVTHDLRTPLTSIQGFSQALMDGTVEDTTSSRGVAGIIHEEAERMGRLIDDLLELARLEAKGMPMALERLAPGAWLREIGDRFAVQAPSAGLTFLAALEEPLPAIRGDARRLERAIDNLLSNACKYTPAGGRVTLRARTVLVRRGRPDPGVEGQVVVGRGDLRDGPWLAVGVEDTGRGIAAGDVGRIFERFYRADKARTETVGSGLGLSIAREIVLAHGGLIAVRSTPGQGTSFTVLLPAQP